MTAAGVAGVAVGDGCNSMPVDLVVDIVASVGALVPAFEPGAAAETAGVLTGAGVATPPV
jgi:hypothetical protein